MPKRSRIACHVVSLAAVLGPISLAFAGDINPPPGPIGPTMKTLAEIEPRTAITTADMPKIISSPGSYYLCGEHHNRRCRYHDCQ